MDSKRKLNLVLALEKYTLNLQTLVAALGEARQNEFISTPEAKGIFQDALKATGFKDVQKVEIKKENKEVA